MAKRQREWAKRVRAELVMQLGGKCVDCGETEIDRLQLDHIQPCEWAERRGKMDASMRMSIMRREAKEGKITVRCEICNPAKSDHNGYQPRIHAIANASKNGNGNHPF